MVGAYMSMRSLYMAWIMEELSYFIKAGQIKGQPQTYHLIADETQLQALATRFGLEAITRLEGRFRLQHERAGTIAATLDMLAEVVQICVVTLEPFAERIEDVAALRFVPAALMRRLEEADGDEEDVTPESLESPDDIFYENDQIDLGAVLAEQLALVLNPYPRKPGAALPDAATDDSANPFAALADKLGKKTRPD